MTDALTISASGLRAQRLRMEVIANNIANAETTDAAQERVEVDGQNFVKYFPYRRKTALFTSGPGLSGVKVTGVADVPGEFEKDFKPEHPHANVVPNDRERGYLLKPNIHPMLETVDMIAASRAYESNIMAIDALKSMGAAALRILA